jgi:hypothetical protein
LPPIKHRCARVWIQSVWFCHRSSSNLLEQHHAGGSFSHSGPCSFTNKAGWNSPGSIGTNPNGLARLFEGVGKAIQNIEE